MSFSDNLENDLKNLENRDQGGLGELTAKQRSSQRERALAAQPHAEKLRNSKFTEDLLRESARVGHTYRTKVHILWIGNGLRLEAREHRLDLKPTPEGVMAIYSTEGEESKRQIVDFNGDGATLAKKWLDAVGPPPAAPPVSEEDLGDL